MKIKRIMTIALLSFLITIPSVSASTLEKESNYEIVYVDSLDEVQTDSKVNNMNDSQLTFYVSDNANESVI